MIGFFQSNLKTPEPSVHNCMLDKLAGVEEHIHKANIMEGYTPDEFIKFQIKSGISKEDAIELVKVYKAIENDMHVGADQARILFNDKKYISGYAVCIDLEKQKILVTLLFVLKTPPLKELVNKCTAFIIDNTGNNLKQGLEDLLEAEYK